MCGIAAVMGGSPLDASSAVTAMLTRLKHRGPDGCGVWVSPFRSAALAHTRLAVFDRRSAAAQPMTSADGRLTITYNGAIYNYRHLRRLLEAEGAEFRTNGDTEVVLRAYERYGASCVDRLQGMFAFVIWNDAEQRGFLARDPLGIKPLYHAVAGDRLVVASELRALAASGLTSTTPDANAVYAYFQQGSVPEPRTLLRDARMLPAGATAWWEHGTLTIIGPRRQPWDVETDVSDEEAAAHARTALLDSVDRHFAGDVRVGVFLSGGADSAAIVALAREAGHDPLAVSLAMPDAADDEGPDAVRTATHFGVPYRVLTVTGGVARRAFGDYLAAVDQPSVDGLNTFVAARFARECGMRVMLSGIGADELFGGYRSFERVPMVARWHRRVGGAAAWAGAMIQQSASPRVRRVGDLLQQAPSVDRAYRMFRGIFTRAEAQRLTSHFTGVDEPAVEWDTPPPGRQVVDEISILELTHYARNQLLRDADVMSMTSGVELRTPFLDADLTSALWRIPAAVRLRPGKRLLASAVSELPPWTIGSPKRCFQFPFDRWLRHEWRDVFAATETASPIPLETWYRKWCVLSLRQAMTNLERAHAG